MNLKSRIICGLLAGASWSAIVAGPARPGLMECLQPDGTTISVRLCGDERLSYWETADGLLLMRCADGFFRYAQWDGDGLQATAICAHNADNRDAQETAFANRMKTERPTKQLNALRTERAENSVLAPVQRSKSKAETVGRPDITLPKKQKSLAILVEFPELNEGTDYLKFSMPNPKELFTRMLNEKGFSYDGATGSVADYFYESSGGNYELCFDVYGPVELYYDISFYGTKVNGEELNAWNMAYEACKALDNEVDFSQYDTNGDGMIDNVYIFYAGQSETNGGPEYTVWPHASDVELITGKQYVFDGVRLNHYACSNEMVLVRNPETHEMVPHLQGIGSVCHEFGHILGLPDLYDVNGNGAFTPGEWSLMDIGSYNNDSHTPPLLSAYERYMLNWLQPDALEAATATKELAPLSENTAFMISTTDKNEMFVLENRQQTGWDAYLPGHGMLIWHIDYDANAWTKNVVNTNPKHQGIDLIEADKKETSDSRQADAFPGTGGVSKWSPAPWSSLGENNGNPLRYDLTEITELENGNVSFCVNDNSSHLETTSVASSIQHYGRLIEVQPNGIATPIRMCDLSGRTIFTGTCTDAPCRFVAPAPGIYLITVGNNTQKITVQ